MSSLTGHTEDLAEIRRHHSRGSRRLLELGGCGNTQGNRRETRGAVGIDSAVPAPLRRPHHQYHRAPAAHRSVQKRSGTPHPHVPRTGENPPRGPTASPRHERHSAPLSTRYDPNDKTFSDPLPHLFARLLGPTQNVLSYHTVRKLLIGIAAHAGLNDGGSPVTFTPHDFRRLFATELVGSGLPLHIVSTLLGHLNLETTRGYTAVFPEQVIQAHHSFIERRRQTRPDHELRSATEAEWAEFEQHFLLRRVALGTCHRPYATPCVHEHACIKCRFLQVDPAQAGRIEDMAANAEERLDEARNHQWLGEVRALEESLVHLRRRRDEASRFGDQAISRSLK